MADSLDNVLQAAHRSLFERAEVRCHILLEMSCQNHAVELRPEEFRVKGHGLDVRYDGGSVGTQDPFGLRECLAVDIEPSGPALYPHRVLPRLTLCMLFRLCERSDDVSRLNRNSSPLGLTRSPHPAETRGRN